MKAEPNISNLAAYTRTPSPPRQPSSHLYARAILPQTQSSVEYELTILHGSVYPALEPIASLEISLEALEKKSQPTSLILVTQKSSPLLYLPQSDKKDLNLINPTILSTKPPRPFEGHSPGSASPVAGPQPPPTWCDPRLDQISIGYWSRVPVSNEFAAGAISTYLETDHVLLGFFDADLFLSDLIEQRFDYCSPFLVSSLLCQACVS
jgi:hypothetical protein